MNQFSIAYVINISSGFFESSARRKTYNGIEQYAPAVFCPSNFTNWLNDERNQSLLDGQITR